MPPRPAPVLVQADPFGAESAEVIQAKDGLIAKDLIAFDGTIFQVLELPASAPAAKDPHAANRSALAALARQLVKEV